MKMRSQSPHFKEQKDTHLRDNNEASLLNSFEIHPLNRRPKVTSPIHSSEPNNSEDTQPFHPSKLNNNSKLADG